MTDLYRGMDRAALDLAYNNSHAVTDAAAVLDDFLARSAHTYARRDCLRDLRYGEAARERFDWFPCGKADAPVFVFIHGGYWQSRDKEDFAFIVEGPLARGFNVVLAEYTLAPEASMTQIVAQIARLLSRLQADVDGLGTAGRPLCLSGHSAGGHLTAMHRSHPAVSHAMPISGLMDLEPIALGTLNDPLQLSAAEIERFSPQRHIGPGVPTLVSVGADELPELVRHSREYAQACEAAGEPAAYLPVPGRNHFSILYDLARPDGVQLCALCAALSA